MAIPPPTPARSSLWWGLRPAPTDIPTPDLPSRAGVLVVGAGITGLSTAVLLARAGVDCLVVDAGRAGSGTTGHSSAKLSILQGSMLQRIRSHAGADATRAYVDAIRAGQEWLLGELGPERTEIRDALTYAVSAPGAGLVADELTVSRAAGLPVTEITEPQLPFPVRAAIGLRDQAQIDPLAAIEHLSAEFRSLGGHLVEGVRVTGLSWRSPWTVETSAGALTAARVILATQAPILDRTFHFARLSANRSYVLAYAATPATRARCPEAMCLSLDDPTRSLRTAATEAGDYLLVGGEGHPVGAGNPTSEHVRRLDDWAREHFGVGEPDWSWAAQDYHLTTQIPSVGPVPGTDETLSLATGFDKWGLASGAAAGHILAATVTGRTPPWADGLRGGLPGPRDLIDTGTNALQVAAHLALDRVKIALPHEASDAPPAEGAGRLDGNSLSPTAVATVDGRTCRVSGVCTHLGGILAWNDVERSWDCPLHGSRFAADGTRIEGPAITDLAQRPADG